MLARIVPEKSLALQLGFFAYSFCWKFTYMTDEATLEPDIRLTKNFGQIFHKVLYTNILNLSNNFVFWLKGIISLNAFTVFI